MKSKITSASLVLIIIALIILIGLFIGVFLSKGNKKEIKLKSNSEQVQNETNLGGNSIGEENNLDISSAEKVNNDIANKENQDTADSADSAKEEKDNSIKITSHLVSWGHQTAKNRSIDTAIIHSSYNALGGDVYDFSKILKEYKDIDVSPHYLIDRKGKIYQLVADADIAYHAGESKMPDGRKSVNNFSLGIEMMNTKTDKLTGEQYTSLKSLIARLKSQYPIKNVLGHSQIAPGRKDDPWNFDWGRIK